MKSNRTITLVLCILVGLFLGSMLSIALASSGKPLDYSAEELAAPNYGRPAPYGQYAITHLSQNISTTANLGIVARTNGYDPLKAIMCDVGAYPVTVTLYARVTSTGDVYTLTENLAAMPANETFVITVTEIAPWMSLSLVGGVVTPSQTTCGIYMQTP